ncbi:MAG: cation:proton antiporter [Devosia sp.]|uniref:monovalent cation/H(+) antiporter subunit G n=1 Tax=Devosia sp. TaxID=1871048 RepID=UPI00262A04D1|nr:monovalent cation/H(+) antiporter subunit G [Devosia sp.]MDB5542427.1 cation:proton antiporter [Devosia sp.]
MIVEFAQYIAALLILAGALFSLIAAVGVMRLPDLYTRLHAATKAGAIGAGLIFLALAVASFDGAVVLRSLLGIVFLLLSTPVAAHLLARAAYRSGEAPAPATTVDDLQ